MRLHYPVIAVIQARLETSPCQSCASVDAITGAQAPASERPIYVLRVHEKSLPCLKHPQVTSQIFQRDPDSESFPCDPRRTKKKNRSNLEIDQYNNRNNYETRRLERSISSPFSHGPSGTPIGSSACLIRDHLSYYFPSLFSPTVPVGL